jgi:hypothetical protein
MMIFLKFSNISEIILLEDIHPLIIVQYLLNIQMKKKKLIMPVNAQIKEVVNMGVK